MFFTLTPEQKEWQRLAREFAEKELAPIAAEVDEKDEFPPGLLKKLAQPPHDFLAAPIPKKYGGREIGILATCVIIEELAAGLPVAVVLMELSHVAATVLGFASEELRNKYLPRVAGGEGAWAYGLTEPGTGSDLASLQTRAELVGNEWVINGRKRYMSMAHIAIGTLVMARTAKGISAFLVDPTNPGFKVVEKIPCIGLRGHQDEGVVLDNCRVPKGNLIGEEGKGLKIALSTLNESRTTLCAGFVGLARVAHEAAIKFAKGRDSFGKPLAEHQAIRFPLVEVAAEIEAARLLTYKAAWLIDNGLPHRAETSMAKAFSSEVLLKATNLGVHVHGGFGCTKRYPVERYFRDARIWVFAQGSPEIQKEVVAREIFK